MVISHYADRAEKYWYSKGTGQSPEMSRVKEPQGRVPYADENISEQISELSSFTFQLIRTMA
jgi:hypothetical protein